MADRSAVTLTFLAESRQAQSEIAALDKALARAEVEAARYGRELSDMERDQVRAAEAGKRLGRELSDVERAELRAGVAARETSSKLTDVGERFDRVDTRAMGAKDAVTGVGDSMTGVALIAKGDLNNGLQFALAGLSDLGSAGYNTVIPMLRQLVTRFGAVKVAAFGALGVLGLAAGAIYLVSQRSHQADVEIKDLSKDVDVYIKTGGKLTSQLRSELHALGDLSNMYEFVGNGVMSLGGQHLALSEQGKALEDQLIKLVDAGASYDEILTSVSEATGAGRAATDAYLKQLPEFQAAVQGAAERQSLLGDATQQARDAFREALTSATDYYNFVKAQSDPIFAATAATKTYNDSVKASTEALQQYGANSPEYQEALVNQTQAHANLNAAVEKAAGTLTGPMIDAMGLTADEAQVLKDKVHEINGQLATLNSYNHKRISLQVLVETLEKYGSSHVGGGGFQERAAGGPVTAGTPYIVGEKGVEMFVPNVSGTIIPHDALMAMRRSGSTTTTVVNHNYVTVAGLVELREFLEFRAAYRNNSRRGVMVGAAA